MSRLTLRLPETLHQQLINLAEGEGVSLNQYIVYALTRQVTLSYSVRTVPKEEINQQNQDYKDLLKELGRASEAEIETVLSEREKVEMDDELNPEIVARLQERINSAKEA